MRCKSHQRPVCSLHTVVGCVVYSMSVGVEIVQFTELASCVEQYCTVVPGSFSGMSRERSVPVATVALLGKFSSSFYCHYGCETTNS